MSDRQEILRLDSEEAAWKALAGLLSREIDPSSVVLDLNDLKWATAHIRYSGGSFSQTVTASSMRGLIELQNDFYRSAARILKDDGRVTRLTDAEKSQLELVFKVGLGSSDFLSQAAEQIQALGVKALEKLTGRQILIGFIVLLLLYFGSAAVVHYMDNQLEERRIELQEKQIESDDNERKQLYDFLKGIVQASEEKKALLNRATKSSDVAADIAEFNRHAIEEIIRNIGDAEEITIQQTKLDASDIRRLTRASRAKSEKITIKGIFRVAGVQTDDPPDRFMVRLESEVEGIIIAELEDPLIGARYQRAIQRAEWSQKPVRVHIVARRVGEQIRDAKIVKASVPRGDSA